MPVQLPLIPTTAGECQAASQDQGHGWPFLRLFLLIQPVWLWWLGAFPPQDQKLILAGVGTEKITASRWILAADWPIRTLAW